MKANPRSEGNHVFYNSIDLPAFTCYDVEWADVDNDGDLDLLSVGFANNQSGTRLYLNDWNSGTESFTFSTAFTRLSNSVADFADYDGDGDLDLVLAGYYGITGNRLTSLWDNDGTGGFTQNAATPFAGVDWGDLDWGDLNGDGIIDLMLSGYEGGTFLPPAVSYAYTYTGGAAQFDTLYSGITPAGYSNTALGDYDHDGDPDLLIQGDSTNNLEIFTAVYRNDGSVQGMVRDMNVVLPNQSQGTVEWIDYDGDGDLDIFVSGFLGTGVKLYTNVDNSVTNQPPAPPSGLSAAAAGPNAATFSWTAPADDVTPSVALTYHLMLDTLGGNGYGLGAALADTSTGRRTVAHFGDIRGTSWTMRDLDPGKTYVARVSAIDAGLAGSAFSEPTSTIVMGLTGGTNPMVLSAGPVPASTVLTLRFDGLGGGGHIEVVSLDGKVLLKEYVGQLDGHTLSVGNFSSGMQLLKVIPDGQDKAQILRFIKN